MLGSMRLYIALQRYRIFMIRIRHSNTSWGQRSVNRHNYSVFMIKKYDKSLQHHLGKFCSR